MAATLKDIANYVGTSVTTVSKVLGNREIRVSETKRQEILDAAEKLNYLPNASGVNLKKGSTDAIAVIVGDLLYPYYAKLLKQLSYCLNEHGKSIIVCDADNNFRTEIQHYQRLKTGYVDGAIIVPSPLTLTEGNIAATLKMLDGIDLPVIFAHDGSMPLNRYSTVGTAAYQSGALAARHLLELGHRRIAYISESLERGMLNPKLQGFKAALAEAGCEVRRRGNTLSLRHPGKKGFIRLSSIDGYSGDELRAVLAGEKEHTPRKKRTQATRKKNTLLIDIEAKLQAGKGGGYERWAKVFNVKQMAQTYNYLREHGLLDYAELEEKASAATEQFHALSAQIKAAETRMAEIAVLKTHIINYAKTRDVYAGYRKAGYSKKYLAEHESDILLHKAAKNAFDELGVKKLPTVKSLQEEYAKLLAEKKAAYAEYRRSRDEMRELLLHKQNVNRMLGKNEREEEKKQEHDRQ